MEEVDVFFRKGKRKGKSDKAKKGGKKGQRKVTQGKVTENRKWNTHDLMVSVEIVEKTDTKLLIVGTSSNTSLKAKVKARTSRNPTSQRSRANKLKRRGHQTLLPNRRVCLK